MKKIHSFPFTNQLQLTLFLVFWLCYFTINTISTLFFENETFRPVLLLHSLLYTLGGLVCSFLAYKSVKFLRAKIQSNTRFLLLSVVCVYAATLLWVIVHHFSWWMVSGEGTPVIRISVYPVKALLFSIITLAAVLLLLLTENKLLTLFGTNGKSTLDLHNIRDLFDTKESGYDDTILLPVKNKVLNFKINSIKLIQANDYYSNLFSDKYDKTVINNYSLKKWEEILPKKHFLRIHRSSIINLNYVENIEKMDNNTYEVKIKGIEQNINMSRRCAKTVLDKFRF